MYYSIILLILALIILCGIIGETKKLTPLFLAAFILTLVLGTFISIDGITFGYGNTITESVGGDPNITSVAYDTASDLTITPSEDVGVFALGYLLLFGSFAWLLWGLVRSRDWFKQELKYKYFGKNYK